jgi:hypothetical protein
MSVITTFKRIVDDLVVEQVGTVTMTYKVAGGGGEGDENVIETISVNGTNIPPVNKKVDLKFKTINDTAITGEGNIVVEGGGATTEYNLSIDKKDVVWDGTFIKISHTGQVKAVRMKDITLIVDTIEGEKQLNPIVVYLGAQIYNGDPVSYFLIRDVDGVIKPDMNFDKIILNYNIVSDSINKYDTKYKLQGRGIVSNHSVGGGGKEHSRFCVALFKGVIPDFEHPVIRTELDVLANYSLLANRFQPKYCELRNTDLIFTPVQDGATWEDQDSNSGIIEVASHFDNTFTRQDITPNATTFKNNAIAVSARAEDLEDNSFATTYGFGLEFFEDLTPSRVDIEYGTEKVVEDYMCGATTDATGTILTSTLHPEWVTYTLREVGDLIWLGEGNESSASEIVEILSENSVRISPAFPVSETTVFYPFGFKTLGNAILSHGAVGYHGTQSWACPIVSAKLKLIQLETGASWHQVRMAARATASNNGVWDMYRGFGIINVLGAINYIYENYQTESIISETARQLDDDNGISELLIFTDILDNSPVPKRSIVEKLGEKENTSNKQNSLAPDGTGKMYVTVDAVNGALGDILTILNSI